MDATLGFERQHMASAQHAAWRACEEQRRQLLVGSEARAVALVWVGRETSGHMAFVHSISRCSRLL